MSTLTQMKKGGQLRAVVTGAVNKDTFILPKGFQIDAIYTDTFATTSSTISLGTTEGGVDIMAQITSTTKACTSRTVAKAFVSMTADTTIHIAIGTPLSMNVYVLMSKLS